MAWNPLSIIDAIDASPAIQRAKERQEVEAHPPPEPRIIGQVGASGDDWTKAIALGLALSLGIVVLAIVIAIVVTRG